jgi:hypothetical protein
MSFCRASSSLTLFSIFVVSTSQAFSAQAVGIGIICANFTVLPYVAGSEGLTFKIPWTTNRYAISDLREFVPGSSGRMELRRVNVDMPALFVERLNHSAAVRGLSRQAGISCQATIELSFNGLRWAFCRPDNCCLNCGLNGGQMTH